MKVEIYEKVRIYYTPKIQTLEVDMNFGFNWSKKNDPDYEKRKKLAQNERENKIFHRRCDNCFTDRFFVTWSGIEVCSRCFAATMNIADEASGPSTECLKQEKQIENTYEETTKKQGVKYEKGHS